MSAPNGPEQEEGRSLWSDAWRRLKRNKLSMFSLFFIIFIAAAGFLSPLLASHVTHFSLDEQHTLLANQPPGTKDVSIDHPTYDGDKAGFKVIDLNGDGIIRCKHIGEEISCPELEAAENIAKNHYDFLLNNFDKARGNNAPKRGVIQPDDYLNWHEFPKTDADLSPKLRGWGLAGPDAFRKLDVNGDNVIANWEVTEVTRFLRYRTTDPREFTSTQSFQSFIVDHDTNGDLAMTVDEYPGAPKLRTFVFGTDSKGRDILTRMLYGGRISMLIGLLATLVSLIIGVTWGAVSGYFGGRIDNVMMRIVDVLYGLPYMFIVILLMVIAGRSTIMLFIALGAVQWLSMARIVRGQVMSLKTREFVEAARAVGVGHFAIIFRHLIRNAVGPVVVYSTLLVPAVILSEAFLSFLGLGVQPPDPSWGNMIAEGTGALEQYPWLIIFPGTALALTLFAMNALGDGVRDAIDPKMQKG